MPRKTAEVSNRAALPPLGAHMSIAGGVDRAVERARSVESTALQIFLKNSNQWRGKVIADDEAARFKAVVGEAGLVPVVAHTSYLINLGTPNDALAAQSIDALVDELNRAAQLGVAGVVLHPGAHMGEGEPVGIARISQRLKLALERTSDHAAPASIYLETTAGQGSTLGWKFEHLAEMIAQTGGHARIAVCLDTCHVFAAGYAFTTAADVQSTLAEFDRVIGLQRLRCIHVNDSKMPFGSRRDRHEHIGQGQIGEPAFGALLAALMAEPRLHQIPIILETPKGDDLAEDRMNLATLRRLAGAGKSAPNSAKPASAQAQTPKPTARSGRSRSSRSN